MNYGVGTDLGVRGPGQLLEIPLTCAGLLFPLSPGSPVTPPGSLATQGPVCTLPLLPRASPAPLPP